MSLLKYLIVGAAAAAGYNYITKRRPDGGSIADDLKAKAPEWMEKARPYIDQIKDQVSGKPHTNTASQDFSSGMN